VQRAHEEKSEGRRDAEAHSELEEQRCSGTAERLRHRDAIVSRNLSLETEPAFYALADRIRNESSRDRAVEELEDLASQVPGREHLRREGLGLAISAVLILDEAAAIRDS